MTDVAITPASQSHELSNDPAYQRVLADCQEICEAARSSALRYMWTLGKRISEAVSADQSQNYAKQVVLGLEKDLVVDRTTLWRCIQAFRTFSLDDILDESSRILTWEKVRMLLPLDKPTRDALLARIRSGELRTDNDVRLAIGNLLTASGQREHLPFDDRPELWGIKGLHADTLRTIWGRSKPIERVPVVAVLVEELELEKAPREEALPAAERLLRVVTETVDRLRGGAQ